MEPFRYLGSTHLITLTLCVLAPVALIAIVRMDPTGRTGRKTAMVWGVALFGLYLVKIAVSLLAGTAPLEELPLWQCRWTLIVCLFASLSSRQIWYDIVFFFGTFGALQAMLMPSLSVDFPSKEFFFFFVLHGGIVGHALLLTFAAGRRPTWKSIPRALSVNVAFILVVLPVNLVLDRNFGFLRSTPEPTRFLGPWPWYILVALALTGLAYVLMYLPWAWSDWRSRRTAMARKDTRARPSAIAAGKFNTDRGTTELSTRTLDE